MTLPAELVERLRTRFDPRIVQPDELAREAATLITTLSEELEAVKEALRGVFARLDHPGNGGQHVNYFLRWPEVESARAALLRSIQGEK